MYQNQDKENLKQVAWGLDIGHEDRTRLKSLMFVFAYFLRFILCIFLFLQAFYLNANHLCFRILSSVKNSESPPIRNLVYDHIQVSRLIGYFVIIQREELYKSVFLV